MTLVARDFYLDTKDNIAYKNAISYRLRYRLDSTGQLHNHETAPYNILNFPYRCEMQAKVDRKELESGFSTVKEARLEFRIESPPFSIESPPPPPPWGHKEYLQYMQTGYFKDMASTPGKEVLIIPISAEAGIRSFPLLSL